MRERKGVDAPNWKGGISLNRKEYDRKRRRANLEKDREQQRARRKSDPNFYAKAGLRRRHKMTLEEYEVQFQEQQGLCAICRKPETRIVNGVLLRLAVDHNHTTDKNRELLCHRCNTAIGLLDENPMILVAAIEYLKRHGGINDAG